MVNAIISMREGEACKEPPFPYVMSLWDNPKAVDIEMNGKGLAFSC